MNEMSKGGQLYGDGWQLDLWGNHLIVYTDVEV